MNTFLVSLVYLVSAYALLPKPSFSLRACRDVELADRVLSRLYPDFATCFGDSLFFASPFTACGRCRDSAVRTAQMFQNTCKLPPSYVQFGADKLQVYVNWANKDNVDAICHTESVSEGGQNQYKYNCLQALINADTVITNAKAKAKVNHVYLTFTSKDKESICNNCTKILVNQFRGRANTIPFTYSFIPISNPEVLLKDITGVCGYTA